MDNKPYRSVLGSVMWGQLATRPDLSFTVSLLSRFQANPGPEHWKALLHVVGYIKNTLDYGLTYSRDSELFPTAFVDADHGGCRDTYRSTSGYVFTMASGPVTWSSKRQATVSSSCKVAIPRGTGRSYGIRWRSGMRVTDGTKVMDGRKDERTDGRMEG